MRFIIFLLAMTPMVAAPSISPTIHEEGIAAQKEADQTLQNLNRKIQLFLSQRTAQIKKNEAHLKEMGKWEQELKDDVAFRDSVKRLQEQFLKFKDAFVEVVASHHGFCSYSHTLRAIALSDLTEWYAQQLDKVVLQEIKKQE